MAQTPPLNSNNPFRRKAAAPSGPSAPPPAAVPPFPEAEALPPVSDNASPLPSGDQFRGHLQALPHTSQPPPATSFQKPKVVKKVRVQSPPPSSPESAGAPGRFPPAGLEDDDDDSSSSSLGSDEQLGPFGYAASTGSIHGSDRGVEPQPILPHRPPPNPFQKTLRDFEVTESMQDSSTELGTKGTLDVDAFKRLLLTGQAPSSGPSQVVPQSAQPPFLSADAASTADTSSTSRQSIYDTTQPVQETPRTSHDISEQEVEDDRRGLISSSQSSLQPASSIRRNKPPPPSSRHGKLIKAGAGSETNNVPPAPFTSPPRQRPPTPSDVNKPLPLAPQRPVEDVESVFDREAAGKVPEPEVQPGLNIILPARPPTPPNVSHAVSSPPPTTAQPPRKPVPPPRRQPHGRSESRTTPSIAGSFQQDDAGSPIRRSSADSTRSRSSSLRVSVHAPAPPPPRRPSHAARASNSFASQGSEKGVSGLAAVEQSLSGNPMVTSPGDIPSGSSSSSGRNTPAALPQAPLTTTLTPPQITEPTTLNHLSPQPQPQQPQPQTQPKMFPPPPPPARNPSVRAASAKKRPASLLARRETPPQQPPQPPPRRRGSSGRGSLDGGGVTALSVSGNGNGVGGGSGNIPGNGAGSINGNGNGVGLGLVGGIVAEEPAAIGESSMSVSAAGDLLADLGALQREVDALRGRLE